MFRRLNESLLFVREFFRHFHTTGAILPSGRWLAGALCRFARQEDRPRRILEVGPGTGAVTKRLVSLLGPEDRLDLCELNTSFVKRLRERFAAEPSFQSVAQRTRILHCPVEDLPEDGKYDVVISGLPLNNFSAETVEQILGCLTERLGPGGTLSFFEYIAVRAARTMVSRSSERARLEGISQALARVLGPHEFRRDWVWPNVPPAWVHHVRMQSANDAGVGQRMPVDAARN